MLLKDKVIFYRELGTMENAGISILQALSIAATHSRSFGIKRLVESIEEDLRNESTLYEAFSKHPSQFSETERAFIKAGEKTGSLDLIFRTLSEWFEFRLQLQRTFIQNLLYPAFLIHFAACMANVPSFFLGEISIPEFGMKTALILSPFYGLFLFFFFLLPFFRKNVQPAALFIDRLVVCIPFIRGAIIKLDMLRFAQVFRIGTIAGLSIKETIEIGGDICNNQHVKSRVRRLIPVIEAGEPVSKGMRLAGMFPSMVIKMFETGEEGGKLEEISGKISDYYTDEVKRSIGMIISALNFLIYLSIIIFIAWSVIGRFIYTMSQIEEVTGL